MMAVGRNGQREAVLRLLASYAPLPAEAGRLAAFLDLLDTARPLSRRQFDPGHLTASGFVLSTDRTKVLLIHHRRLDRWMQPGGHIDPGDIDPMAAARREISEETGVAAIEPLGSGLLGLAHHPIPPRSDEPAHRHFDLKFAFVAIDETLHPSDEVHAAAWVGLDDIGRFGADDETRHEVQKLRTPT
jgi:8-oxo-dGTP pyrophosphatase MutT (NUDIX family)